MNDDERIIVRSLDRLARYAPVYEGAPGGRDARRSRRVPGPLLAIAAILAVVCLGAAVVLGRGSDEGSSAPPATGPSTEFPASPQPKESVLELPAVNGWDHLAPGDCATWTPRAVDSVVSVDRLEDSCISRAPRSETTVILAPYTSRSVFGRDWTEVTSPWRSLGGHELRRLARGPLMEFNSRVIDAVVCQECGEVIVVLGPDPSVVHGIVESVREDVTP